MAKISGDGKIPKRIGDYIVYPLEGQNIIRRKSGFTSKGMKKNPKFERSRNNATEFGKVSSLCKKMRIALKGILPRKNNLAVCNSLVKMMRHLLSFDIESAHGQRNLQRAFENDKARLAFSGYNFNPDCILEKVLLTTFSFESLNYSLSFGSFKKEKSIVFPDDANSVGFRLHCLSFDFGTGESLLIRLIGLFLEVIPRPPFFLWGLLLYFLLLMVCGLLSWNCSFLFLILAVMFLLLTIEAKRFVW